MKNRYADRRSKLGAMLPKNSAVVIAGAAVQYRNADSSHAFRQDSNFWYLTGFNEPESTLVLLINESKDVQSIAFVPKKDALKEIYFLTTEGSIYSNIQGSNPKNVTRSVM